MSRKEGLDGIMEQMFELKPCFYAVPPTYGFVPAGI
jgi:hypothetical protein